MGMMQVGDPAAPSKVRRRVRVHLRPGERAGHLELARGHTHTEIVQVGNDDLGERFLVRAR